MWPEISKWSLTQWSVDGFRANIFLKNPEISDRYSSGYSLYTYTYRTTLLYTVDKFYGITKVLNTQHGSYINLNLWTLELPHII